jgi:uncharacterized membrane protein YgcG
MLGKAIAYTRSGNLLGFRTDPAAGLERWGGMKTETRLAAAAGALLAALGLTAAAVSAAAADDWGQRAPGQHVYDMAQVLTPAQVADLEAVAAAVDRTGAPTVVYLRQRSADDHATRQDARALMDAWSLESAPGAKDGLVLLVNLRPGDPRHGSAALVAGAHAADGRLSDARLQSVYSDAMMPRLARGDLADALSAALTAVTVDLRPPTPTPASPEPERSSAGPVAVVLIGGGLLTGLVLLVAMAAGSGRSGGNRPGPRGGSRAPGWTATDAASTSSFTGGDGGASSGSTSGGGSF